MPSILQSGGAVGGAGGCSHTLGNPVTPGSTLVIAIARRNGGVSSVDGVPVNVGSALGRSVSVTNFTTSLQIRASDIAGGDGIRLVYATAVGDEQTLFFNQTNVGVYVWELDDSDPTTAEVKSASGTSGTRSLGTFTGSATAIGLAAYVHDTSGSPSGSPGAGWTERQDTNANDGHPGHYAMDAAGSGTEGLVISETGGSLEFAGIAVSLSAPPIPLPDCRPMMFDVHSPGVGVDADQLTYLETLCSARQQEIVLEELGAGAGRFVINRYSAEATEAILGSEADDIRIVKVRIPAIQEAPLFGFILNRDHHALISQQEAAGEDLTIAGRGALAYLDFARMAPLSYLDEAVAVADPVDGVWRFERPDFTSSLGFLASDANGTGALTSSWQLPSISPAGDDVLLLAFLQARPNEDLSSTGWTNRVQQDTSLGANELRYAIFDRYHATGAAPYDDVFAATDPVRWTAAQLAFRATGGPSSPETGAEHQAASGTEDTITAALSGSPTAGNVLIAYATLTTDGPGSIDWLFESGWTILQRIPNKNTYTGQAVVAFKPADGTETNVTVVTRLTPSEDGAEITTTSLLVAEYPIVYQPLKAGEILYLVVAELLASKSPTRPVHPVPLLSIDFTYELDSDGNPWDLTPATAQFTARVTESVWAVVERLLATGTIVVEMDVSGPGLLLRAFNRSTYGRDLTGLAFASDVVRLEAGVNIVSGLSRDRVRARAATHAWAAGDDGTWALATHPDAATRVTREVAVAASGVTEGAALEAIGEVELDVRDDVVERLSVGILPGVLGVTNPLVGHYLPGPAGSSGHVWHGDTITLDTGAGEFDYADAPFRVAAITIGEGDPRRRAVVLATDLEIGLRLGSNMEPDELGTGEALGGSDGSASGLGGNAAVPSLSGYQKLVEKSQPGGYASLAGSGYVPPAELGSGAEGAGALVLHDDGTWGEAGDAGGSGDVFAVELQHHQTRRWLDRAGQWRDPLVVGDQVLAVATAGAAVVGDTKYHAWPDVERLRDGRFITVWTRGDSHNADNTGVVMAMIGVENLDGTVTWGMPWVVYDHASQWVSAVGVTVLSTGRVVISAFIHSAGSDPLDGAYVLYSDNVEAAGSASTWTGPITVNASLTSYSYASGRVIELPLGGVLGGPGRLLQFVEGKNSGDTHSRIVGLVSDDGGDTWGSQFAAFGDGTTRNYYEACGGILSDGRAMALLRTSDGDGDIYVSFASAPFTSWSAPALAFAGHGQPNWIESSTRTIIAGTRKNEGVGVGDTILCATTLARLDADVTDWEAALTFDSSMYEMEYVAICETSVPGRYLVVEGFQPTSSTTNADIYAGFVTEGLETIGGGGEASPLTTKGDVHVYGAADARLAVGSDQQGLGADSTQVTGHRWMGFVGPILIVDSPSTPLVFADLVQNEDQDDLVYADL